MKIIVTGSAGFVGKHTVEALKAKGYEVVAYDISEGLDLLNKKQLKEVIKKGDKVLHLAAIARFADADKDPLLTYKVNVIGTQNVVDVCDKNKAERLIYASTGSVYMPIEELPITEEHKVRGNSVYGCSKAVAEKIVEGGKTPWIILRYAHLYGKGKMGHGAIGGFLAKMELGQPPVIYGGQQTNDFTYIKDIVESNILALETEDLEALNEAYNIGTGTELTTDEVFEIMAEKFDYHTLPERFPQRGVDPGRFAFSVEKAKKLLKFSAKYDFRQGLDDYIQGGIE